MSAAFSDKLRAAVAAALPPGTRLDPPSRPEAEARADALSATLKRVDGAVAARRPSTVPPSALPVLSPFSVLPRWAEPGAVSPAPPVSAAAALFLSQNRGADRDPELFRLFVAVARLFAGGVSALPAAVGWCRHHASTVGTDSATAAQLLHVCVSGARALLFPWARAAVVPNLTGTRWRDPGAYYRALLSVFVDPAAVPAAPASTDGGTLLRWAAAYLRGPAAPAAAPEALSDFFDGVNSRPLSVAAAAAEMTGLSTPLPLIEVDGFAEFSAAVDELAQWSNIAALRNVATRAERLVALSPAGSSAAAEPFFETVRAAAAMPTAAAIDGVVAAARRDIFPFLGHTVGFESAEPAEVGTRPLPSLFRLGARLPPRADFSFSRCLAVLDGGSAGVVPAGSTVDLMCALLEARPGTAGASLGFAPLLGIEPGPGAAAAFLRESGLFPGAAVPLHVPTAAYDLFFETVALAGFGPQLCGLLLRHRAAFGPRLVDYTSVPERVSPVPGGPTPVFSTAASLRGTDQGWYDQFSEMIAPLRDQLMKKFGESMPDANYQTVLAFIFWGTFFSAVVLTGAKGTKSYRTTQIVLNMVSAISSILFLLSNVIATPYFSPGDLQWRNTVNAANTAVVNVDKVGAQYSIEQATTVFLVLIGMSHSLIKMATGPGKGRKTASAAAPLAVSPFVSFIRAAVAASGAAEVDWSEWFGIVFGPLYNFTLEHSVGLTTVSAGLLGMTANAGALFGGTAAAGPAAAVATSALPALFLGGIVVGLGALVWSPFNAANTAVSVNAAIATTMFDMTEFAGYWTTMLAPIVTAASFRFLQTTGAVPSSGFDRAASFRRVMTETNLFLLAARKPLQRIYNTALTTYNIDTIANILYGPATIDGRNVQGTASSLMAFVYDLIRNENTQVLPQKFLLYLVIAVSAVCVFFPESRLTSRKTKVAHLKKAIRDRLFDSLDSLKIEKNFNTTNVNMVAVNKFIKDVEEQIVALVLGRYNFETLEKDLSRSRFFQEDFKLRDFNSTESIPSDLHAVAQLNFGNAEDDARMLMYVVYKKIADIVKPNIDLFSKLNVQSVLSEIKDAKTFEKLLTESGLWTKAKGDVTTAFDNGLNEYTNLGADKREFLFHRGGREKIPGKPAKAWYWIDSVDEISEDTGKYTASKILGLVRFAIVTGGVYMRDPVQDDVVEILAKQIVAEIASYGDLKITFNG